MSIGIFIFGDKSGKVVAEQSVREGISMFEQQYDEQMAAEIQRLEGRQRAAAGHPEWENACAVCGGELSVTADSCDRCQPK